MPDVSLYPIDYDPFAQGSAAMYGDPGAGMDRGTLPAAFATAGQIEDIGSSLVSGHAAADYQHWIDPTGSSRNAASGFSAPAMIAGGADAVTNYLRFANDIQAGRYGDQPLMNPDAVARGAPAAFDMVGVLGAGGLTQAEKGAAGIFGGRLSATANHAAADRAEQMLARGEFPSDVLEQTGWFRGSDGAMRYEIPDHGAYMRGSLEMGPASQSSTVGGAFVHPDLYAAYPDLAAMRFAKAGVPEGARGAYVAADPLFDLTDGIRMRQGMSADQTNSTMLHELQHAVQAREGFAQGSSPVLMQAAIDKGLQARNALSFRQEMDAIPGNQSLYDKSLAVHDMYRQMGMEDMLPNAQERALALTAHQPLLQQRASFLEGLAAPRAQSFYERAAGEAEARNVQYRRALTPEQRAASAPWTTQDVPNDRQITKYASGLPIFTQPDQPPPSLLDGMMRGY